VAANILRPIEVVLRICEKRDYSGKEAHLVLNRLSKELHEAISRDCGCFSKIKLIPVLYDLFDESCHNLLLQEHYEGNDHARIHKVEILPGILSYLLDTTIICPETEQIEITQPDIKTLVLGAHLLKETCAYSNFLHRNDFEGGFFVGEKGDIRFRDTGLIKKIEDGYLKKMALLSEKMKPDESKLEVDDSGNYKKVSMVKDAIQFDPFFIQAYNLKLSTLVGVAETVVLDVCTREYGVEVLPQNQILKRVRQHSPYSKSEIKESLHFLGVDKNVLSKAFQYYQLYDAPVTVSRQPIIRLFDGYGEKGDVVYLGPNALFRSILLLFADIDRGIIKLADVAERWSQEKGPEFEKSVKQALCQRGFKVIRITDPPPEIGEIDAVACCEKKQVLLIVEAKAPKMDLSLAKTKIHLERSRKWLERHDKKVKWAKDNIPLVTSRLNLPEIEIKDVIGLIVTRVPWYTEPDLPYKLLSFEEFERLLDQIIS
jgi:hypothetical protein